MKKVFALCAVLVLLALVLSGCGAPEPTEEETPTQAPTEAPTEAPTPFVPTMEPTVTPRPMDGDVETPEPGTLAMKIDPIDKPPINFEPYVPYTSANLNLTFNIPSYWEVTGDEANSTTIVCSEPLADIRSGETIPASVVIAVNTLPMTQTVEEADLAIDQVMNTLREQYPSLETSSKDNNAMLGETGRYVTYWIEMPTGEGEETLRMRGRCLVVPKDRKLFMVRYICPADLNTQYVNVFYEIRGSLKEL